MRRKENDDLYIHGWAKFFHSLFMFVTYPLRKPINFVCILGILVVFAHAPIFLLGVQQEELLDWYQQKIDALSEQIEAKIGHVTSDYLGLEGRKTAKDIRKKRVKAKKENKQKPTVVAYAKKQETTRKKSFAGDEIDKQYQHSLEEYENKALRNTGRKNPYYGRHSKFNLSFPAEIIEVRGKAEIYNANELSVGGIRMFLFGIYTDVNSSNNEYAVKFLHEETDNQEVRCEILAYSSQNVATSVCYTGVQSLNDKLVSSGFAKKVMQ